MRLRKKDVQTVEMQMGPMIDMVFLLLVFFMVSAKPVKQESDINIGLPGTVAQEEALEIPDEQRIQIQPNGQVMLNDQPMDSPASAEMPALLSTLKRFKESADSNKSEALITIDADDAANHERIVQVLNACAQAKITGVTFADAGEEE
ncbi:MAG: ExbD/TolR family protein [Spartobacteria bacterium]